VGNVVTIEFTLRSQSRPKEQEDKRQTARVRPGGPRQEAGQERSPKSKTKKRRLKHTKERWNEAFTIGNRKRQGTIHPESWHPQSHSEMFPLVFKHS
jgi:hypothetical protein